MGDLRGSDPKYDPRSVKIARRIEKAYAHRWLKTTRWEKTVAKSGGSVEATEKEFNIQIKVLFQELLEADNKEESEVREGQNYQDEETDHSDSYVSHLRENMIWV